MSEVEVDLLVVGAGAAGLLAAIAGRRLGDRVLVVERTGLAGGATLTGTGELWLPANQVGSKAGEDSPESASDYLEALLGEADDASARRRAAFVRTAPKLAKWLASSNVPLHAAKGVGDNYPGLPGARTHGRVLQVGPIDRRLLGDNEDALTPETGLVRTTLSRLPLPRNTSGAGDSLVAHLLHRATANGVDLWLNTTARTLLVKDGRVTGATIQLGDGATTVVTASRVLIASGGFGRCQSLREEYLPLPTDESWSISGEANDGSALALASFVDAATAELDQAWWIPVVVSGGRAYPVTEALRAPHSFLVDGAGDRFTDETGPAYQVARSMYERSRGVRAVPSWLVMDNRHRQSAPLGPWAAGSTPKQAIEDGEIVRAASLNDLAMVTGIDRAGLLGSAVRFNGFASKGSDLDFGRGEVSRDAKGRRRNASLGKIDRSPFWAVRVYPGDAGTKGGIVTDANSRVLRRDGSVVEGLYAAPGSAASIFTGPPPAPGAPLAESLVAAFLAVTDKRP